MLSMKRGIFFFFDHEKHFMNPIYAVNLLEIEIWNIADDAII